jgi:hypothetical protein
MNMVQNFDELVDSSERAEIEKILNGYFVNRCPHLKGRGEYYFFCATELTEVRVDSADLTNRKDPAVQLRKSSNMLTYFCINKFDTCVCYLDKEK